MGGDVEYVDVQAGMYSVYLRMAFQVLIQYSLIHYIIVQYKNSLECLIGACSNKILFMQNMKLLNECGVGGILYIYYLL